MTTRKTELHNRIRDLRIKNHFTQKQLSEYLNIDVSTYAHYERGDRTPDAKKLAKLANLYKLEDEMLGAKFPIETFVSYEKAELERLKRVLDTCEWRKGDHAHNREEYNRLRYAALPILKAREEALSLPDIIIGRLVGGETVKVVRLDCVGEALINRYLEETDNYFKLL